jgi:hypothetical protein
MLTPRPIEPDCPRIRRVGSKAWFGNFAISRSQPESTARIVVTVSHSDAKNSGKKTAKFCSIKLFNSKLPSVPHPRPRRLYLEMAVEGKRSRAVLAVLALKLQRVECRWRHVIAQCPRRDAPGAACGVYYADLREP